MPIFSYNLSASGTPYHGPAAESLGGLPPPDLLSEPPLSGRELYAPANDNHAEATSCCLTVLHSLAVIVTFAAAKRAEKVLCRSASVCDPVTLCVRRIILSGEGNAQYPALSSLYCFYFVHINGDADDDDVLSATPRAVASVV